MYFTYIYAMQTRIIRVGNSQGIVLPKKLLEQYRFSGAVDLRATPEGLLIVPVVRSARQDWDARFAAAEAADQEPEGELLESFSNAAEDDEWQW